MLRTCMNPLIDRREAIGLPVRWSAEDLATSSRDLSSLSAGKPSAKRHRDCDESASYRRSQGCESLRLSELDGAQLCSAH